jgi:transposase
MVKQQYDAEFKLEAIRRLERTGESIAKVAADLGVKENTMHGWVKRYREKTVNPFPGSGKLSDEDEKLRKLEREIRELREENDILKKAATYFAKNQK